jgi:uncharacterized protein
MSLSTFKIQSTGEMFQYDNTLNTLLGASGCPIGLQTSLLKEQPQYWKSNAPSTIKVVLGHACNYNCSYCVQKDIGDPSERPKNIMTRDLIKKLKKHLDLTKIKRIELWGGETLLYWRDIVEIIGALDHSALEWYIPTNGTVLREKHVEFFATMKGKMQIGISHDGPGHEALRGPEFLHRKVDILRGLQETGIAFSFNGVISKTNYDLFKTDAYFRAFLNKTGLREVPLVFELGRTYETGAELTQSHAVSGEQIPHYRSILQSYLKRQSTEMLQRTRTKDMLLVTNLFHFGGGVLSYAKSLKYQKPIHHYSNCGTDSPGLITLDINANLRTCQNTGDEYNYGTLESIESAKMQHVDYSKNNFCTDCSVLRLCNRSCPIKLPLETFLINHAIEQAHYSEIQLSAFGLLFNSEVVQVD